MPKLYSSKKIQSALNQMGFNFISQKGSHGKLKNQDGNVVILPMNKKEIPQGTLNSILRQAGITLKQLKEIIEK
ncbi:MAG: type II toxin-antitoxin system HicA family toxin [Candidatus Goldiibacteriota bacterium]